MDLSNRQLFVLSYLLNHPQGLSAEHLASQAGISVRTLQNEIQGINLTLDNGIRIHSSGKRGYVASGGTHIARAVTFPAAKALRNLPIGQSNCNANNPRPGSANAPPGHRLSKNLSLRASAHYSVAIRPPCPCSVYILAAKGVRIATAGVARLAMTGNFDRCRNQPTGDCHATSWLAMTWWTDCGRKSRGCFGFRMKRLSVSLCL